MMEPKICRLCLTSVGVIPLFQEKVLITRIAETVPGVSVIENDGFPDHICSPCESELTIAYCFIKKCQASDKALRELQQVAAACVDDVEEKLEIDIKDESEDVYQDAPFLHRSPSPSAEEEVVDSRPKVKHKKPTEQHKHMAKVECNECGLRMVSVAALNIHKRTHTGEKPFECQHCDKCFSREANLTRHLKLHIRGRKRYTRKVKIEKFTPEQCVICGLLLRSPSAMKIHARTHTDERPYKCDSCEKTFTTKGCLKRHVETNHLQPGERIRRFICEVCGRSFYRKADIIVHIGTHTGEKPHCCPYCPMRFLQISSLIRHKRVHTGDRPFSCPVCNKRFADRSLVSKHLTVHSDVRNFKCHMCSKAFKSSSSLRAHFRLHTNGKDIVCSYCGLTFSTKGNLKTHTRRLHSEKSGQCTVCMKPYANLEEHMRKHTGEKPFVCSLCNRGFSSKVSLSSHISFKHENSHKYKCSIGDCSKTFPIPSMLEFHLHKQHTNHTPHVCQYCSKGFFRASDLSRHLKVSHTDVHHNILEKIKSPID